jgi:hypothetical protein
MTDERLPRERTEPVTGRFAKRVGPPTGERDLDGHRAKLGWRPTATGHWTRVT